MSAKFLEDRERAVLDAFRFEHDLRYWRAKPYNAPLSADEYLLCSRKYHEAGIRWEKKERDA